ncbi:hypothetical protein, partial [Halobacteriovorax sp.]|uniref:hypothetical protein n=1 Tax=Halobacteriovorax sp. TaxID=2020862 RepID=UPI003561969A
YAYNDGGGNSSYEVNTPVADGSEVGVAVGFVGAGIACGVSTVIGGGSLCEPTTFSFIAAGITAVFEAFMSFSDSEDFADFQDDLDREYDRINNRYDEIHKSLSLNNSKIVSSICREIEIEEVQSSVDSNINLLEGVLTMVEQAHSTISKKSEDYKTILKMDEQLLQVMLKTKREKFIKQVSTNLSALRERYASVGLELMKFYKIELLPIAKKIKISRGLNKLHLQKKLLETIAKGDMSFGDYKVWNAYKRSLK